MTTAHTPGPWILKSWHEPTIITRDGDLVATSYADKNRKLIAAAPQLLEALEKVVATFHYCTAPFDIEALDIARAAIRNAKGEA